jgi:hypothetical protein
MDGKGWKPEYGISPEGIEVLGFVEALPREARREMAEAVRALCKSAGYLSLHDDLREVVEKEEQQEPQADGKVIPLFRNCRRR